MLQYKAMIACENLTKRYGSLTAVQNLSFTVPAGELYGFLGPNGAGKTTTIKMLTGLLKPTSGSIRIGDYDLLTQSIEAKRLMGYVPDNPFLYERLTGQEFLELTADLWGVGGERRVRRIQDLLKLFELEEKTDVPIQNYSRGMRQKITLASALLHEPQAMFLDEPTVGLDPKGARLLKEVLRELTSRGAAVMLSTHILEVAERLCDRVGILNRGELIAEGTPRELLSHTDSDDLETVFLTLTGEEPEYGELIRSLE